MKTQNEAYLNNFIAPIKKFHGNDYTIMMDIIAKEKLLREEASNLAFIDFMFKVEESFGVEAKYCERFLQYKYLKGIQSILIFFVVLTIISIVGSLFSLLWK